MDWITSITPERIRRHATPAWQGRPPPGAPTVSVLLFGYHHPHQTSTRPGTAWLILVCSESSTNDGHGIRIPPHVLCPPFRLTEARYQALWFWRVPDSLRDHPNGH